MMTKDNDGMLMGYFSKRKLITWRQRSLSIEEQFPNKKGTTTPMILATRKFNYDIFHLYNNLIKKSHKEQINGMEEYKRAKAERNREYWLLPPMMPEELIELRASGLTKNHQTQRGFAKALGVSQSSVSRWERGVTHVPTKIVFRLTAASWTFPTVLREQSSSIDISQSKVIY